MYEKWKNSLSISKVPKNTALRYWKNTAGCQQTSLFLKIKIHVYVWEKYERSFVTNKILQEKGIKQNKQPNNGQCCLFIVGVSTGFGHAMTFFKMKKKCQVVLKYKKRIDRVT